MAIFVKPAPSLSGESAATFVKKASQNAVLRGSVDFSREIAAANRILERTKLSKF